MANLVRRRIDRSNSGLTSGRNVVLSPFGGLDPFKLMDELLQVDSTSGIQGTHSQAAFAPRFDVKETADSFVFLADVPGVREDALDVTFKGNTLTIAGERRAEPDQVQSQAQSDHQASDQMEAESKTGGNAVEPDKTDRYIAIERSHGSFSRSFKLPPRTQPDGISASLNDGVLTVVVPKTPEEQQRKIAVRTNAPSGGVSAD